MKSIVWTLDGLSKDPFRSTSPLVIRACYLLENRVVTPRSRIGMNTGLKAVFLLDSELAWNRHWPRMGCSWTKPISQKVNVTQLFRTLYHNRYTVLCRTMNGHIHSPELLNGLDYKVDTFLTIWINCPFLKESKNHVYNMLHCPGLELARKWSHWNRNWLGVGGTGLWNCPRSGSVDSDVALLDRSKALC